MTTVKAQTTKSDNATRRSYQPQRDLPMPKIGFQVPEHRSGGISSPRNDHARGKQKLTLDLRNFVVR